MAQLTDIPRLVGEFVTLAKEYMLQETVEPAKRLGHFAGFSIGATALWAIGFILLAVAGLRTIYSVLPEGPYWEALSYVIATIAIGAFMALVIALVPDRGVHDAPSTAPEGGTE